MEVPTRLLMPEDCWSSSLSPQAHTSKSACQCTGPPVREDVLMDTIENRRYEVDRMTESAMTMKATFLCSSPMRLWNAMERAAVSSIIDEAHSTGSKEMDASAGISCSLGSADGAGSSSSSSPSWAGTKLESRSRHNSKGHNFMGRYRGACIKSLSFLKAGRNYRMVFIWGRS